ncbi:hypothetical protein [Janthinobacterium sp. FW305-128]|uniref:hypothetical protein n=1 Tax=Janthinobacterium sp. FW305-128 TaxID=2775055 RepID=UPI001E34CC83|nr:hypothetical protein [Janthinobacterium sp. FW305-128]MCC7684784.1 hypothetical protein [Janthinobacterium sp. FW305-128]
MAVTINTKNLSRKEALDWIADRGIERLPQKNETLEYVPVGTFNQFDLARTDTGFSLTSHVLA